MALTPTLAKLVAVGPLETIVDVGWSTGWFVAVSVLANYDHDQDHHSRGGRLTLQNSYISKILNQVTIHNEAKSGGSSKFTTKILGLMQFKSLPNPPTDQSTRAFTLKLFGALTWKDTSQGSAYKVPPFCGATIVTWTFSPYYARYFPFNPTTPFLFQDVTQQHSSPAGSGSTSWTNGPMADVTKDDIGKGGHTDTGISHSIWYQDKNDNWVDTKDTCDNLKNYTNKEPPENLEGFQYINVAVWPATGYDMLDPKKWTAQSEAENLVVPKKDAKGQFGGPCFTCRMPRPMTGTNEDGQPQFKDIDNGDYVYRLATLTFAQFESQPPWQKLPLENVKMRWALAGAYPLTGNRYDIAVGTAIPAGYFKHTTLPAFDEKKQKAPFLPPNQPPGDTKFTDKPKKPPGKA